MKRAEAAHIDVKRKADRERVNDAVYKTGSRPQRVCARL